MNDGLNHPSADSGNGTGVLGWAPLVYLALVLPAYMLLALIVRRHLFFSPNVGPALVTLLSSLQMWAIGVAAVVKSVRAADKVSRPWFGLGLCFFFLALDEAAEIHEYLSLALTSFSGLPPALAEGLVFLTYLAIVFFTLWPPLGREILSDPFSKIMLVHGGIFLVFWLIGNAGLIRLPETFLKIVAFSFLFAMILRQSQISRTEAGSGPAA